MAGDKITPDSVFPVIHKTNNLINKAWDEQVTISGFLLKRKDLDKIE